MTGAPAGCLVVGVCEHPHAIDVLRYAVRLASRSGSEVVAVHVRRRPVAYVAFYLDLEQVLRLAQDCEEAAFRHTVAVLGGGGARWRFVATAGVTADRLSLLARRYRAGAIVVGSPPRHRIRRLLGEHLAGRSVAQTLRRRHGDLVRVVSAARGAPVPVAGRPTHGEGPA